MIEAPPLQTRMPPILSLPLGRWFEAAAEAARTFVEGLAAGIRALPDPAQAQIAKVARGAYRTKRKRDKALRRARRLALGL